MNIILIILLLMTIQFTFAQNEEQDLRLASSEEMNALIPKGMIEESQKYNQQIGPMIESQTSEKILRTQYLDPSADLIKTKENYQQYLQKMINQGMDKTQIIHLANNMNLEIYNDLVNLHGGLEADKQEQINNKNEHYLAKLDKHIEKWQNIAPENMTETQKLEYEKDATNIRDFELQIDKEINDITTSSQNIKKIQDQTIAYQKFLQDIETGLDYSKINSQPKIEMIPQASKVELYIPKSFNLNSYLQNQPQANFLNKGIDQPLCFRNIEHTSSDVFFADADNIVNNFNKHKDISGRIYFSWGYNRAWHTDADATFTTSEGTFTIHDAHGNDRPSPFDPKIYFNPASMSIPQYNIKLGYMFNDKFGLEIGTDHMKWVFDSQRRYDITGEFSPQVYIENPNAQHGWDAVMPVDFDHIKQTGDATWLTFEHSDGYNYPHISGIFNQKIYETKNKVFALDAQFGAGVGLMVPKTKVMMHRDQAWNWQGLDNKFHIAGAGVHADTRLRMTFFDRVFIQGVARGTAVKINNALVYTNLDPNARLEHAPIFSGEISVEIGASFPINSKKKK